MSRKETQVSSALVGVLERLSAEGSPVAGRTNDERQQLASFALRRIQSFGRRKVPTGERSRQVADLAKGLASHFEREAQLVGGLIKDYEYMAEAILLIHSHNANTHDV